jgi:hypothetical protein
MANGERSFFWKTGFAQTLKRGLQHRFALDQSFN